MTATRQTHGWLRHLAHTRTYLTPSPTPSCFRFTPPQLYVLRKVLEAELRDVGISDAECYICSLSGGTIVYKGQLTPGQVRTIVWGSQLSLKIPCCMVDRAQALWLGC